MKNLKFTRLAWLLLLAFPVSLRIPELGQVQRRGAGKDLVVQALERVS